jgi:hypothetical protein
MLLPNVVLQSSAVLLLKTQLKVSNPTLERLKFIVAQAEMVSVWMPAQVLQAHKSR